MSNERELLKRCEIAIIEGEDFLVGLLGDIQNLLAQPEQEEKPVCWIDYDSLKSLQATIGYALRYLTNDVDNLKPTDVPLYLGTTSMPPFKGNRLTGKEISHGFRSDEDATNAESYWAGVEYAEQAHGIGEQ
jgi:hypothetical protein